jgi:hypothetical protein
VEVLAVVVRLLALLEQQALVVVVAVAEVQTLAPTITVEMAVAV